MAQGQKVNTSISSKSLETLTNIKRKYSIGVGSQLDDVKLILVEKILQTF